MSDLYTTITQRIVEQLEAGTPAWVRPWSTVDDPLPTNAVSKRPYRGVNQLLLSMQQQAGDYPRNVWMTFRQALQLGGCVRKGEHGCTVVYYDVKTFQDADTEEERRVPLLKHFTVFNVEQVDGLPESFEETGVPADPAAPSLPWEQGERAEALIAASGARIKGSGFRAYYSPAKDCIHLPARALFVDEASFYATLLHELAHWSGHPSRLNRQFGRRFGDAAYAMEELVAELASAFLCAHCRIDGRLQHASYIASWLEVLQRDKRALFTAATQAQKVADLLIAPTVPAEAEALDERLALAA